MREGTRPASALAFLALFVVIASLGAASMVLAAPEALRAFDGEWLYVEDRTEGRAVERQAPSMGPKFALRVEEAAVILARGQGASRREIRLPLDGSPTETEDPRGALKTRYRGEWKDGAFTYFMEILRKADNTKVSAFRTEFRVTADGLLGHVSADPPTGMGSVSLFRHPKDIPLPTPAKAGIGDLAWLAGAWVGTRGAMGAVSIEERWSPPLGGSMLGTSRTVSRGKMSAFEFLRVVERDGGLVYIAQPNGGPPTEFALTEIGPTRAVFVNPRHDYPQRIVYEVPAEGRLSASIGFAKGGSPPRFEFKREAN